MKKLQAILGYTAAILMTPVVLATFIGSDGFSKSLANVTGVKISPWMSGGDVEHTIEHGQYRTNVHKPVFDGLCWKTSEGFVQVDWTPCEELPDQLTEAIDYDADGNPDFEITLDKKNVQAELRVLDDRVGNLEGVYKLKTRMAVRVHLQNRMNSK